MAEYLNGSLVPFHWVDEIRLNEDGVVDEEYSKEVAWELLKALTAQGRGEEIEWPKDRYLKAIIRGYLQQEKVMQDKLEMHNNSKKGGLTDKQVEEIIYQLKISDPDIKAKKIVSILNTQYGCNYREDGSFVYKNKGWKRANEDLKKASADSAENEEKSVEFNFV